MKNIYITSIQVVLDPFNSEGINDRFFFIIFKEPEFNWTLRGKEELNK